MGGADVGTISPVAQTVATLATTIIMSIVAALAYWHKNKARHHSEDEAVVVSATFSDRGTINALTEALNAMQRTLAVTNRLLEEDAQRRHDEVVVRKALRDRGIVE